MSTYLGFLRNTLHTPTRPAHPDQKAANTMTSKPQCKDCAHWVGPNSHAYKNTCQHPHRNPHRRRTTYWNDSCEHHTPCKPLPLLTNPYFLPIEDEL